MTKKQKFSIGFMLASMVLLLTFGAYSFFISASENNKNEEVGLTSGNMSLTFSDGDAGINKRLEFGNTVTKIFTIENTGTVTSSLSLDWDNLVNTYLDGSLTYKLSYSETDGGEKQEILPSANVPTSSTPLTQNLASELSVPAGKTYYYYLDITLNNTDKDQTSDLKAQFSTKFNVGLPRIYRYYKLSINPNGGTWKEFTDTQEYQLQNNETLDVPNPTKVGHSFTGWSIEGSTSTIENNIFTMGIENTTLTANYTKNKYSVLIDINGTIQTEETEYGGTINLPENPTKEGYTFTNWSITGGTLNGNTLTITDPQDISVTANFIINNYKYIVYHNKQNIGGSGYTRVDADTDEGEAEYNYEITPGTKKYTGFETPPVQSLTIKAETTYPPVLNKVEYNYTRNKHTLTINLNGGSSTSAGKEMYYEETEELVPPTKTGYNFTNWTATSGSLSDNTFTMGDADSTVTANYTAKTFTVTYNANGGTPTTQSKTVTYGSKYILPDTEPTRDGYEFLGWFTDWYETGRTEQITTDTTVNLSANQTLYAQWKEKKLVNVLLSKINDVSIKNYNSGNKAEMFTFTHPEATQTTGWSEAERTDYRYIGSSPNNYITFNDETWRIIGVFTVEGESGTKEQRVKIIREGSIGDLSWNTLSTNALSNNNSKIIPSFLAISGDGVNEWVNGSLDILLNSGDYYTRKNTYASTGLTDTSKTQIAPTKWYLGSHNTLTIDASSFYNLERDIITFNNARSTNVIRNVGLFYPSDYFYTYANDVDNICYSNGYNCYADGGGTPNKGWLYNSLSTKDEWFISATSQRSYNALTRYSNGYIGFNSNQEVCSQYFAVRPCVYLRSDIQITDGDGSSSKPYVLKS